VDHATIEARKSLDAIPGSFVSVRDSISNSLGESIRTDLEKSFGPHRKGDKERPFLSALGIDLAASLRNAAFSGIGKLADRGFTGLLNEIFHPRKHGLGGNLQAPVPVTIVGANAGVGGASGLGTALSFVPGGGFLGELFKHFLHFAKCGIVPGVGHGDSVPALLTPGERVVPVGSSAGNSFSFVINHHGDNVNQGDVDKMHQDWTDQVMRQLQVASKMVGVPALG
jgi:hypothetical protein